MSTSFDFPPNPTLNQIVALPNGSQAQWNGTAWVSVSDNVTYPLEIPKGGTGATNPSTARVNLGLNSATGEFILDKDGTVALPGLAWKSEPGLGWYRSGAGQRAFAVGGNFVEWLNAAATNTTNFHLLPRASGVANVYMRNQPLAAADFNELNIQQANSGAAYITTSAAGSAVRGKLTLDAPQILFNDGTVAAPNIAFASEAGLGWYRESASKFSVAAQGSKVMDFGFSTTSTFTGLYPRAAGATTQMALQNGPAGAANLNYVLLKQDGASGGAYLQTGAAGSATRGSLTLDAPQVLVPGGTVWLSNTAGGTGLLMEGAAAYGNDIVGRRGGVNHWLLRVGGGAAQDDFNLYGYNDSGTGQVAKMAIIRNINAVYFFDAMMSLTSDGTFNRIGLNVDGWRLEFNRTNGNLDYVNSANTVITRFDASGYAFKASGAGGWLAFASDARAKQDIEDYTEGLEAVLALRPRSFAYLEELGVSGRQIGFVEQESRGILPSLPSPAAEKLGIPDLKTNDPTAVTYMLVNAIKTLNQRLEAIGA